MTVLTQKERFVFQFFIISVAVGLGVGTIKKRILNRIFLNK